MRVQFDDVFLAQTGTILLSCFVGLWVASVEVEASGFESSSLRWGKSAMARLKDDSNVSHRIHVWHSYAFAIKSFQMWIQQIYHTAMGKWITIWMFQHPEMSSKAQLFKGLSIRFLVARFIFIKHWMLPSLWKYQAFIRLQWFDHLTAPKKLPRIKLKLSPFWLFRLKLGSHPF